MSDPVALFDQGISSDIAQPWFGIKMGLLLMQNDYISG